MIENVYETCFNEIDLNITDEQYETIQKKILSGKYVLSPMRVSVINVEKLNEFLCNLAPRCPDYYCYPSPSPGYMIVVRPDYTDVLVHMGLAQLLFSLSIDEDQPIYDRFKRVGDRVDHLIENFHSGIREMGHVREIHRIEFLQPLPHYIILNSVKNYVGDGSYVYNLISSFLMLPYLREDGVEISNHINSQPVGELSRILYLLRETFDREFTQLFPGVVFERFITQVFIANKAADCVVFDKDAGYALLDKLGMCGNIVSIGPGDEPIACHENMTVSIDYVSKMVLLNQLYTNPLLK